MRDTFRNSRLIDGSHTIAAADNGGGLRRRDRHRDGGGALREGSDLKHAHRPIPYYRLGLTDRPTEDFNRLRSNVHTHPSRRDAILWHTPRRGAGVEAFGNHVILGEVDG